MQDKDKAFRYIHAQFLVNDTVLHILFDKMLWLYRFQWFYLPEGSIRKTARQSVIRITWKHLHHIKPRYTDWDKKKPP